MRRIASAGLIWISILHSAVVPALAGERKRARPDQANTLDQVARSVDVLEEKILDDGTVVIKQPDIYSQSRMTLYRKNFEQQLYKAIDQFNVVLSARVFRSDQAAFLSQSNLAAAAGQAMSQGSGTSGTTGAVTQQTTVTPPALVGAGNGPGITPNGFAPGTISRPDSLTSFGSVPFTQGFAQQGNTYGLGVEPTVYLDQLKRYQDHLNEIRRVNMGDDIADSAGYGLHLVRMPVSIQPGECTRKGYGAVLTTSIRHGFGSDFLYLTYRNLVINDLVDQLAPVVFEMVRSDAPGKLAGLYQSNDLFLRYRSAKQWRELQFDTHLYANEKDIRARELADLDDLSLAPAGGDGPSPLPRAQPSKKVPDRNFDKLARRRDPRSDQKTLGALEITRVNERDYPIPPSEFGNIFFTQNLYALALAAREGMQTKVPKAGDVRVFLRRELETAYDLVTQLYADPSPEQPFIIEQYERSVEEIAGHVRNLEYGELEDDYRSLARALPGKYRYTDGPRQPPPEEQEFLAKRQVDVAGLERLNPHFFRDVDPQYSLVQELTILSYAIAVESGLLNNQLRIDMKRVFAKGGGDCGPVDGARFFAARPAPEAEALFREYVKKRWPIITFALDPVVDQQNIADASSVRRDLQLAFAFAFSTGQINFQQLNQYQRRIEVDAETIALNRTVTSFAHGNDTFGFRFQPRFQNPPIQKSNLGALGSLIVGNGGTGPNRQLKNSKLEAGQRELSAVVIMPSFLQGVEIDVTGNWFPLHDPDQMKTPTPRMIEQGRQVVELQQALGCIRDGKAYRPGDLQRLATRVHQIESMLPMQTYDVAVPFENTLGGFQLFQQGITALVPQLDSFEGVESIKQGLDTEVVLFGKHFSIQETSVIAGGRYLVGDNLDGTLIVAPAAPAAAALAPAPATNPAATTQATPTPPTDPTKPVAKAAMNRRDGGNVRLAMFQTAATPVPGAQTVPTNSATVGTANSFVTAATKATVPAAATLTYVTPGVDIVSREVMRITIPGNVRATEVFDAQKLPGQTGLYVEVYVATPTGISNRLLIPWIPDPNAKTPDPAPAPKAGAFDLRDKDAAQFDLYYQWLEGRDGKPELVATRDPGAVDKVPLKIGWDSPVGLAPRTLQATFSGTANGQAIALSLPANSGTTDDYAVDRRQLALMLLKQLEVVGPHPGLPQPTLKLTVAVQPWLPREGMGYRVQTDPKPLGTPLTVNLKPLVTNIDALSGVPIAPAPALAPPPAAPDGSPAAQPPATTQADAAAADARSLARVRGEVDAAVGRASSAPAGRQKLPERPNTWAPAGPRPTTPADPPTIRDPQARPAAFRPAEAPRPTPADPARRPFGWLRDR